MSNEIDSQSTEVPADLQIPAREYPVKEKKKKLSKSNVMHVNEAQNTGAHVIFLS